MNFAFYDLETTGTSPAFDQPLQFAAILTDGEFIEIERVNLRCRITPHIIPSPWALAVTGVHPAQLLDPAAWSRVIRAGSASFRAMVQRGVVA